VKIFLSLCCMVCLPLKYLHINSDFGYRSHPISGKYALHSGIDLHARQDTVLAILDGIVASTGYQENGLGINVRLEHGQEIQSVYGHLSQVLVGVGASVSAGEPIGITGATGKVTGEHLHFSIRYKMQSIHPIQFLYALLIKKQNE
jgi:murein DD-endopeptidase MepM/ murein hydrolase activator NlpD